MKKLIVLAFAAPSLAFAQPNSSPQPGISGQAAALRDAALRDDRIAWDMLEGLTTEVGQRMAGTEAEARGREWAVRKLTELGFSNVHVEPFEMDGMGARRGARRDRLALPAAHGGNRARQ